MESIIFTDGASRGNPGRGGYASVVVTKDKVTELGGREDKTTNNRMEIKAALVGLAQAVADKADTALVYTDSSYLINSATKWIHGWQKNNWQTKAKQDVLNKDLWLEMIHLLKKIKVSWKYVGGHVGILGNERCDHIATDLADGNELKLYKGDLTFYDLPNILKIEIDESKAKLKKESSNRSNAKAYSYVSSLGGVVETHRTWAECEKRVKGKSGARFKKALTAEEERQIMAEFENFGI